MGFVEDHFPRDNTEKMGIRRPGRAGDRRETWEAREMKERKRLERAIKRKRRKLGSDNQNS